MSRGAVVFGYIYVAIVAVLFGFFGIFACLGYFKFHPMVAIFCGFCTTFVILIVFEIGDKIGRRRTIEDD